MSQIDKVIYIPLLFWFWILFISFYFFIFSYFLAFLYSTLKLRNLFFDKLIDLCYNSYYFIELLFYFTNNTKSYTFFNIIYVYFKSIWYFSLLKVIGKKYYIIK